MTASEVVGVVDIGGTQTRVGLVSRDQWVGVRTFPTDPASGPDTLLKTVTRTLASGLESAGFSSADLRAIGVAVPGPVDSARGIVRQPANLGWTAFPLGPRLEEAFPGARVLIEDDARCAALGEAHYGAGREFRTVWYGTISTGVGGGLVIDGQLFSGAHQASGEWGHLTIDAEGPLCLCGKYGCLETLASGSGILRAVRERDPARCNGQAYTTQSVFDDFRRGDALASEVIHRAVNALALGLAAVVQIVDPELLVLGGGVIEQQADVLLPRLDGALANYVLPVLRPSVRLAQSTLANAGLWGAYRLATAISGTGGP